MMNRNHLSSNATSSQQNKTPGIHSTQYQQPNLNYYYNNNNQNHAVGVRQTQSTLFEDSPETTTAYGRLLSGGRGGPSTSQSLNQYVVGGGPTGPILQNRTSRDNNTSYKHQSYYPQPPASTYSQYSGSQSTKGVQQNNSVSGSTRPASHNLYSNEYQRREQIVSANITQPLGAGSYNHQRFTTPTPSAGLSHPSKHTILHDDVSSIAMMSENHFEGGPMEDRINNNNNLLNDNTEDTQGSDVECIIRNLYTKMKNLESKYIDLANFYKQELVKSNKKEGGGVSPAKIVSPRSQSQPDEGVAASGGGLTDRSNHEKASRNSSSNNQQQQTPPSSKGGRDAYMVASERQIINDLIEEKRKLDEDLQTVIALKGGQGLQKMAGAAFNGKFAAKDFKSNIPNREQLEFLNQQLTDTLKEVVENIDSVNKRALNYLSTKQNEMYQLATNRQYNFPPQVKNEALGLWYDSKTKVQSLLSDLKNAITQKKSQIEQNLISSQINSSRKESTSFQDTASLISGSNFRQVDEMIKKELASMRKRQDQYMNAVQKLRNSFRFKENLVKEEQAKMATMIRDMLRVGMQSNQSSSIGFHESSNPTSALSMNQQNSKRGAGTSALNTSGLNDRMTSIERVTSSGHQVMSPFEKKIASYQKSAERRKQNEPRSGSRSRPGQLTQHNSNDPYIDNSNQQQQMQDSQELRLIRSRLKHLENTFEDFQGKLLLRTQDSKDMDRQVDSIFTEQTKFLGYLDSLLATYQSKDPRNKSKNPARDISPSSQSPHFISQQPQKNADPAKMSELIKSNDQIYLELRKANEKYLNQRVENTKLKDEIQSLQSQIEQISRGNLSSEATQQKQQIRLKSRPGRNDGAPVAITPPQPLARNLSSNSSIMVRENEDLKKRIRDLEKECVQLTYYQQEMQRRGMPDPQVRENLEVKSRLDHLCLQVQQFLLAMRRLQRAVNNKDKDIQDLKGDFEKNKKQLELMVKEFREKDEQAKKAAAQQQTIHNSSMTSGGGNIHTMSSGDKRERAFTPTGTAGQRGKSQVSAQTPTQTIQYPPQVSNTQRQNMSTLDPSIHEANLSGHLLPPKKAQIRPKQQVQQQNQQFSQRSDNMEQPILANPDFFSQHNQTIGQNNQTQNDDFNQLLEEIRALSDESERLRRALSDSQRQTELEMARSRDCEKIVADYKEALERLASDNPQLAQLRNILASRELQVSQRSTQSTFGRQNQNSQTEEIGEYVSVGFMEGVKHQVAELIAMKEQELDAQMAEVERRLAEKEEELKTLKRLFVEKLRDIESSFVELSQDMIENEAVQEQASKKLQQKVLSKSAKSQVGANQTTIMDRSLEQVIIDHIDSDGDEDQIEQLASLNDQLTEENRELREHIKQMERELAGNEEMETMRAQFEEIHELNERMHREIQMLRSDKEAEQRALAEAKKVFERAKVEMADDIRMKERAMAELQRKINECQLIIIQKEQLIDNEVALRAQKDQECKQEQALVKKLKADKLLLEETIDSMRALEKELQAKVAVMSAEIDMINQMRGDINASSEETSSQADDQQRILENPTDAAHHYLRLMTTVQKEYKILQLQMDKLQHKYDELKESNDELKLEARESAQEVMNMESAIFDLRKINEQLTSEVAKSGKDSTEQEIAIREQLIQGFNDKLAFKDQELADVNNKLSRISQANIEMKSKCDRLETANSELTAELTEAKARIQYIELQLEMSNQDSERDSEKLISTQHLLEGQIEKLNVEIALQKESALSEKEQLNARIEEIEGEKIGWLQQIDAKTLECQDLKNTLEQKIQDQQEAAESFESQKSQLNDYIEQLKLLQQGQEDQFKDSLQKNEQELTQLKADLSAKEDDIERLMDDMDQIKQSKDAQIASLTIEKDQQKTQLSDEIGQLKLQIDTLNQEQAELVRSLTEKQDQQTKDLLAQKASENDRLASEITHLKTQVSTLIAEKDNLIVTHSEALREHQENAIAEIEEVKREDEQKMEIKLKALKDILHAKIQAKEEELLTVRGELETEIEDNQAEFERVKNNIEAELRQKILELENFKEAFDSELKEKLSQIETLKGELEAKLEEKQFQIDKLENSLEQSKVENIQVVTQHTAQVFSLRQESDDRIEELRNEHQQAIEEMENMHQSELSAKIEEIEGLTQQVEDLQSRNEKFTGDIEELSEKQAEQIKSMTETQEQQIQDLIAQNQKEIESLNAQIVKHLGQIGELTQSIETQEASISDQNTLLSAKTLDIEGLNEQLTDIKAELASKSQEILILNESHEVALAKIATEKEQLLSQIKAIKEQADIDKERIKKAEQLKALNEGQQSQVVDELNGQIEELKEQIADKDDIIKLHTDKYAKLVTQMKEVQAQYKSQTEQSEHAMQVLQQEHEQAIETLTQEHSESLEVKQLEIQVLSQEKAALHEKNTTLQRLLDSASAHSAVELTAVRSELAESKIQVATLEQRIESLEGELSIATSENGDQLTKIAEIEADNGRLHERIQELIQEIEEIERNAGEKSDRENLELAAKNAQLESEVAKLKAELLAKNEEIELKIQELENQGRDLEQLYTEKEELEVRIGELEAQLQERLQYQESVLEGKVEEIMQEAIEVRKAAIQEKDQREQILSTSLIIQEDSKVDEIIADISSNTLRVCKRVNYLEKVWLLVVKDAKYSWIDQDNVPIEKLKGLKVAEEEPQGSHSEKIQRKIEEVIKEKDAISNMLMLQQQKNRTITTPRSTQSFSNNPDQNQMNQDISVFLQLKQLELDSETQRVALLEEQRENASLKQAVLHLQQKMNNMGNVIIQLTSTGGNEEETLKKLANQNQDYKNRYHEQVDLNSKMELENEQLRKQIAELQDISFARNFQSQAPGGLPSSAQNNNNLNDLLNASSIMDEDEKIDINTENERILQERVIVLEHELDGYRQELERIKGENQDLKLTNTSQEMQKKGDDEVLENFRHVKPLFIQFLEGTPLAASKKEDLLPVIFSMLQIQKDEVNRIKKSREQLTLANTKDSTKKGVLGIFGKK